VSRPRYATAPRVPPLPPVAQVLADPELVVRVSRVHLGSLSVLTAARRGDGQVLVLDDAEGHVERSGAGAAVLLDSLLDLDRDPLPGARPPSPPRGPGAALPGRGTETVAPAELAAARALGVGSLPEHPGLGALAWPRVALEVQVLRRAAGELHEHRTLRLVEGTGAPAPDEEGGWLVEPLEAESGDGADHGHAGWRLTRLSTDEAWLLVTTATEGLL